MGGYSDAVTTEAFNVPAVAIAYFGLYSLHHVVGTAPEEEFELIREAGVDLA